jgi:hypothetical protein
MEPKSPIYLTENSEYYFTKKENGEYCIHIKHT